MSLVGPPDCKDCGIAIALRGDLEAQRSTIDQAIRQIADARAEAEALREAAAALPVITTDMIERAAMSLFHSLRDEIVIEGWHDITHEVKASYRTLAEDALREALEA